MGKRCGLAVVAVVMLALVLAGQARAGDPAAALAAADRLACAFLRGMTARFTSQGGVSMRPPLDPNNPGLTVAIKDRTKGRAVLEEGAKETPGLLVSEPMGISILARDPTGTVTLVTVFAKYVGASDNFPMVASQHGAGLQPRMMQRYGLCRVARPAPPAPEPKPEPKSAKPHS